MSAKVAFRVPGIAAAVSILIGAFLSLSDPSGRKGRPAVGAPAAPTTGPAHRAVPRGQDVSPEIRQPHRPQRATTVLGWGKISGRAGRAKRETRLGPEEGPQADHSRAATPGQATRAAVERAEELRRVTTRSRRAGSTADQAAANWPGALRRVGPAGPHARRKARPGAAPRSGAALIQYGSIRQWSCLDLAPRVWPVTGDT